MVSLLNVAGEYTAEIAELTEIFLEFSAVLAGFAVNIHCDFARQHSTGRLPIRAISVTVIMADGFAYRSPNDVLLGD